MPPSPTQWVPNNTISAAFRVRPATTLDGSLSAATDAAVRTAWRAGALLGAVALLAVSCSASPAVDTGPLGKGSDPGGICGFLHPGEVFSYGETFLQNTGGSDAVITKVDLVHARNLRLVASYVVPIKANWDMGAGGGFPLPPEPGIEWSQRAIAVGAAIPPPAHGVRHYDLLTVLKPTGPLARAEGIDVFYQEAGTRYHMQTDYRFVLFVGKQCPDNWPLKYPDD